MTAIEKHARRFVGWAEGQGGESLPTTNEFEIARVKHADGTLVVYRNKRGDVSFSDSIARKAWAAYLRSSRFPLTKRHKRTKTEATMARLIQRDGNACFFCGCTFGPDLPSTLEHLLSIAHGGNNKAANLVLACEPCNREVGSLDVADKIKIRDQKRGTS